MTIKVSTPSIALASCKMVIVFMRSILEVHQPLTVYVYHIIIDEVSFDYLIDANGYNSGGRVWQARAN